MQNLRKTGCALLLLALPLGGYTAPPAADSPGAPPCPNCCSGPRSTILSSQQRNTTSLPPMRECNLAGALPDPTFSVEWRDIPNDAFTLAPTQVGSVKYTLAQTLPLGRKLDSKQQIAEAEAAKARRQRSTLSAALRARLTTAFIQRYQARQNEVLLKEELGFLREVEQVA